MYNKRTRNKQVFNIYNNIKNTHITTDDIINGKGMVITNMNLTPQEPPHQCL